MKKILLFVLIGFSTLSFGQILNGTATLSAANNMTVDLTVDVPQNEVTIVFTGTNNFWFGFGFGGTQMFNRYSVITTGAGGISERKLGNHNSGTTLTSSLTSINTTVSGSIRTVTIKRPIAGMNSNYFSFPTSPSSIIMIWAKGNGMNLSNHGGGNRGSGMLTLTNSCVASVNQLPSLNICTGDSTLFGSNYIKTAGLYKDTLTGSAGCDSIIEQNLTVSNSGPFAQTDISICSGDSAMVFGSFVNQGGLYFDTIQGAIGCDSILSLQVNETLVNYSINYQLGSGTITVDSAAATATYQWLENCDSTPVAMAGETNNSLVNPTGGTNSYAVIVTINGCSDTSDCIEYSFAFGIDESNSILSSFYPNPVEGKLSFQLNQSFQNLDLEIVNMAGQTMKKFNIQNGQLSQEIDLSFLPKGAYFLKLIGDGKIDSQILLKN